MAVLSLAVLAVVQVWPSPDILPVDKSGEVGHSRVFAEGARASASQLELPPNPDRASVEMGVEPRGRAVPRVGLDYQGHDPGVISAVADYYRLSHSEVVARLPTGWTSTSAFITPLESEGGVTTLFNEQILAHTTGTSDEAAWENVLDVAERLGVSVGSLTPDAGEGARLLGQYQSSQAVLAAELSNRLAIRDCEWAPYVLLNDVYGDPPSYPRGYTIALSSPGGWHARINLPRDEVRHYYILRDAFYAELRSL